MRLLLPLLLACVVAACTTAAHGTSNEPTPGSTTAFDCSFTKPNAGEAALGPIPSAAVPPLVPYTTSPLFQHRNATLGVPLPVDGRLTVDTSRPDGGAKFGWFRFQTGTLEVTGRRLDGEASFRADVAAGYGISGLQIAGLRFGAPGCWEVSGRLGTEDPLTFVVRVDDPARLAVTPEPTPISGACPVTPPPPVALVPPSDINFNAGRDSFLYGNDALIVVLPRDGTFHPSDPQQGLARGIKLGWWRIAHGHLVIATRRLDAPAVPLAADVPGGYGDSGFQVSGVNFPSPGCWEVRGSVGGRTLTFVVNVAGS